jgi:hypothetical protein
VTSLNVRQASTRLRKLSILLSGDLTRDAQSAKA